MNNHLEQLDVSPLLSMQGEKKTLYVVLPHDSLLQESTEGLHGLALREWDLSRDEAKGQMQAPVLDGSDDSTGRDMACREFGQDSDAQPDLDGLLDDFEAANLDAGRQRETPYHEGLFYRGPVGAGWVCQQQAFVAQVVQANACSLL